MGCSLRASRRLRVSADVAAGGVATIAAVTFANGGDNVGVYVPVFATAGAGDMVVFVVVFLVLVAVWCAAARLLVSHPAVAGWLSRAGDVLLPIVLIALGVAILVS